MKPALLLILALALSACGQTPEDQLLDYQQRVARVLDEDIPAVGTRARIERIAVTHFALPLPQHRINLLELLSLNDCRIGQAVAQKNSTLGKLAAASQKLVQELAILRDGADCVAQLQPLDAELAGQLNSALQEKYAARMRYWWNAWLSADEWQHFIATAAQPLQWPAADAPKPAHISLTLNALDYAIHQGENIAAGRFAPPRGMEPQLQQLMLGETLGRWLASEYLLTRTLNQTAAIIENRLARKVLCPTGEETPDASILHNVFVKYYAGQVQPYISRTDQLGNALRERLDRLKNLLKEEPPQAFQQWRHQVGQQQQAFVRANKRHVTAWQKVLRQCGLMPGADADERRE